MTILTDEGALLYSTVRLKETAFGAICGTLSAIATTAAVIVALWQTKYANRKKLKVEFNVIRFVRGCFAVKCIV